MKELVAREKSSAYRLVETPQRSSLQVDRSFVARYFCYLESRSLYGIPHSMRRSTVGYLAEFV